MQPDTCSHCRRARGELRTVREVMRAVLCLPCFRYIKSLLAAVRA